MDAYIICEERLASYRLLYMVIKHANRLQNLNKLIQAYIFLKSHLANVLMNECMG